jgi:hypothetical protein
VEKKARTFKVDSGERAAKYQPFDEKELDCFVFLRKGEKEDGGGEERTMKDVTSSNFGLTKKIGIQSILKKDWSKTCGISKFFWRRLKFHLG